MSNGVSNKLTGQIGEHLVAAKLGSLGFYASPYSGNVPDFDITAVNSLTLKSLPVQVKTSNANTLVHSQIDKWIEVELDKNNKYHFGELLPVTNPEMIWVIVKLAAGDIQHARFFICTKLEIRDRIVKRFMKFMEKHDFKRPGGGGSLQAILKYKELADTEDKWELFDSIM